MPTPPDLPPDAFYRPGPDQFSLRGLLLFMTLSAGLYGLFHVLGFGPGVGAFATVMAALAVMAVILMRKSDRNATPVMETNFYEEAVLGCHRLRERGIRAMVVDGRVPGFGSLATRPSLVLVPPEQAEEARRLLEEEHATAEGEDAAAEGEDAAAEGGGSTAEGPAA